MCRSEIKILRNILHNSEEHLVQPSQTNLCNSEAREITMHSCSVDLDADGGAENKRRSFLCELRAVTSFLLHI